MTRPAYEAAIRAWVEYVVQPLGFDPVIFTELGGPKPTGAFASVRVLASLQQGELTTAYAYDADADELTETTRSTRVGTAEVQFFKGNHDAAAHDLMASLRDQDVIDLNATAGLTVIGSDAGIRRIGLDTDVVPEDRSIVEITWSYTHERAKLRAYVADIVTEESIDA